MSNCSLKTRLVSTQSRFEDASDFFNRGSQRVWVLLLATKLVQLCSALRSSLWTWYVGKSRLVYKYR